MADELTERLIYCGYEELMRQRLVRPIQPAAPIAGAEFTAQVPGGTVWELLSVFGILTTSATVANRMPALIVRDADGVQLERISASTNEAASTTVSWWWGVGLGAENTSNGISTPLPTPPIPMQAGWTLTSSTANLDATDAWSKVVLIVRQWSPVDVIQAAQWVSRLGETLIPA